MHDILCEQFEHTAGKDNCVRFVGLTLPIPSDRPRVTMPSVHRYLDGTLAVFHGARKQEDYDAQGAHQKADNSFAIKPDSFIGC
ncbi:MAG: hypothetical protein ACU841_15605 [Gammaproteobacteria bacterium]